ncbi:MAG: hypothetical protein SWX82_07400 [Cyanobacteriota bacterium]|nr:hypothetical protein [Cyanobacteriota bacterium]
MIHKLKVRRKKEEGRRKKRMGIVNEGLLRVYKPQTILSTPIDQKVRSQVSPFKEMKKSLLQYFKPSTSVVGTDN